MDEVYDDTFFRAAVVSISDVDVSGDFDSSLEYFILEVMTEDGTSPIATLLDTISGPTMSQCGSNAPVSPSLSPDFFPLVLDKCQVSLPIRLTTSNEVGDLINCVNTFVRFSVTVQFFPLGEFESTSVSSQSPNKNPSLVQSLIDTPGIPSSKPSTNPTTSPSSPTATTSHVRPSQRKALFPYPTSQPRYCPRPLTMKARASMGRGM